MIQKKKIRNSDIITDIRNIWKDICFPNYLEVDVLNSVKLLEFVKSFGNLT